MGASVLLAVRPGSGLQGLRRAALRVAAEPVGAGVAAAVAVGTQEAEVAVALVEAIRVAARRQQVRPQVAAAIRVHLQAGVLVRNLAVRDRVLHREEVHQRLRDHPVMAAVPGAAGIRAVEVVAAVRAPVYFSKSRMRWVPHLLRGRNLAGPNLPRVR